MQTYATLDTLLALQPQEVLLQLADDDNDGDFVIRRRPTKAYRNIEAAADEAQAIVDSYIAGRYSLPINQPYPELIVQIASNLALCALYDRRRELDVPEGIKDRRSRYMTMLKDIQSERASIPGLRRPTPAAALVSAPKREFSPSLLGRM
jgi:phage gp36-like protein